MPDIAGTIVAQEDSWEEPLFVALPARHRLARQGALSWPDIAMLRLHLRAREGEPRHFGSLLGLFAPLRDCEEHDVSSEALLDMVSIGMGATIVAKSARLERTGVVYRPISGAHSTITFRALWPRSDRNPLRHRLLGYLRKQIGDARQA
jgi:LysR family transcriptional regulator, hydrogen peroxide-inducible genes activator